MSSVDFNFFDISNIGNVKNDTKIRSSLACVTAIAEQGDTIDVYDLV